MNLLDAAELEPWADEFEVLVDPDAQCNVVRVRGDVDSLSAPTLHAALAALVDQRQDLALDLAQLRFMDASGLGVIADISARLESSGRVLSVRSAPPRARWLLGLMGFERIVTLQG